MKKIKILDNQFAHAPSFGCGDLNIAPEFFEWYRGSENINDIVVITDNMFNRVDECSEKIKIALMIEPPAISPHMHERMRDTAFYNKFDYILTYNRSLLELSDKFVFYPFGGCWIYPGDRKLHTKTKNVSIVASAKKETPLHRFRHDIIAAHGHKIGVYGNGYQRIENKIVALRDYRFQVVIENDATDYWFTEKLIDCFVTGTVPIYCGTTAIDKFFNSRGVILIKDDLLTIQRLIDLADDELYEWYKPYLEDNYKRAMSYTLPENWLWKNFFEKMVNQK